MAMPLGVQLIEKKTVFSLIQEGRNCKAGKFVQVWIN